MSELRKEIRIGNLLMYSDYSGIWEVSGIHEFGIDCFDDIEETYMEYENFEPIPLTEEWLIEFGLNEYNDIKVKDNGYICIEKVNSEIIFYILGHDNPTYSSMFRIKLDYVHQLQNLYFALTGKELTHQKIN